MDACPRYLYTCVYVIVCMSARKKAPVNLLMCPFELYMFIGVSMQLRVVFKYDFLVLIPYCWSVALEKKKNLQFFWNQSFISKNTHFERSILTQIGFSSNLMASGTA